MITQAYVKECFEYCPTTGILTWKERPRKHFKTAVGWRISKAKTAGRVAGCKNPGKYLVIRLDNKLYYAHRIVYLYIHGNLPKEIDHIDGNTGNNREDNLRATTHKENLQNQRLPKDNTSGAKGVHWVTRKQKWAVQIDHTHYGYFDEFELAELVAREVRASLHGEFARHK